MVFALLMRLRQAVLHPSLLLKRIAQNLAEAKGKPKTDEEAAADAVEKGIQSLVEAYGGMSKEETASLHSQTNELLATQVCAICFEVSLTPARPLGHAQLVADGCLGAGAAHGESCFLARVQAPCLQGLSDRPFRRTGGEGRRAEVPCGGLPGRGLLGVSGGQPPQFNRPR